MQITYDAERDCHVFLGDGVDPQKGVGYVGLRDPDGETWVRVYDHGRWEEMPNDFTGCRGNVVPFDWGHAINGTFQLAFAILRHATGNADIAIEFLQEFDDLVVCQLPEVGWHMSRQYVRSWLQSATSVHAWSKEMPPPEKAGVP